MKLSLAADDGADDPMLSLVNLIDVFLVMIATLLLCIANNPFSKDKVTVIRNAGQSNMEIVTMDGKHIQHFRSDGKTGSGQGSKAGTAYRMADGSMVYVPD